ncbi:hypothetical protein [uncultured Sphingomonas sp.]|uniref:hypothetical protein n=1 Tax=uncultured Sphingomonas sp. TaxID=158754 RepID=UPI0035C98F61
MRSLPELLATVGLLVAGLFMLSLGAQQLRARVPQPHARRWLVYLGAGDFLLGAGVSAGAAYHLSTILSE